MTLELFLGLAAYAFATSITPGPNNLMLMASGANFGFSRTIPHMLGVALGFVFMAILMGIGLSRVFVAIPWLYTVLLVLSVVYLLWLAWKIATAAPPDAKTASGTPMTFLQAAGFQWVNPKAWGMALTAVTVYAPSQTISAVVLAAVVFGMINLPSVGVWVILGQELRRVLTNPARLRAFNFFMAALLVASMLVVIL